MNKNFIFVMNVLTVGFLGYALGMIIIWFFKGELQLTVNNLISIIVMTWCWYTKVITVLRGAERRIEKLEERLKKVEFEIRIR